MTVHISSFIARGGAGKTTSTLHLAGALNLLGFPTVLIDADMPQCTLSQMSADGYFYIHQARYKNKKDIKPFSVFKADIAPKKISELDYKPDFILTDCTPRLSPSDYSSDSIAKSNICIIPFNLTPMGIGRIGEHVVSSIKAVRALSSKVKILLLPNQYPNNLSANNARCLLQIETLVRVSKDKNIDNNLLFDAKTLKIRQSQSLSNFGQEPVLFNLQSDLPYDDFINLAETITKTVTE